MKARGLALNGEDGRVSGLDGADPVRLDTLPPAGHPPRRTQLPVVASGLTLSPLPHPDCLLCLSEGRHRWTAESTRNASKLLRFATNTTCAGCRCLARRWATTSILCTATLTLWSSSNRCRKALMPTPTSG